MSKPVPPPLPPRARKLPGAASPTGPAGPAAPTPASPTAPAGHTPAAPGPARAPFPSSPDARDARAQAPLPPPPPARAPHPSAPRITVPSLLTPSSPAPASPARIPTPDARITSPTISTPGGARITSPRGLIPAPDGTLSTVQKLLLADAALALRDEQLAARIVHYKAELKTSPELDRITEQVAAEFSELQRISRASLSTPAVLSDRDKAQLEIELIQSLKTMLARVFRQDKLASVIERKIAEASKRFARLFFESELHEKMRGSSTETKTMRQPEQALYYAVTRLRDTAAAQLAAFDYAEPDHLARATEMLDEWLKGLRHEFLGRTTPELNALVSLLTEGLTKFFTQELPPMLGELSWEVVREARLRDAHTRAGYKISSDVFPAFRQAFERRFLQRLVPFAEDEMLKKVRESHDKFREETIRFVAEPRIFSDVCELVCDAVYDYLYNDGFLDLPPDWRARLRGA